MADDYLTELLNEKPDTRDGKLTLLGKLHVHRARIGGMIDHNRSTRELARKSMEFQTTEVKRWLSDFTKQLSSIHVMLTGERNRVMTRVEELLEELEE